MKNFVTRTLSGAIYIFLIIASILANEYLLWGFFSLMLIIAMREFSTIVSNNSTKKIVQTIDILTGIAIISGTFAISIAQKVPELVCISPIALLIIRLIAGLYLKEENPIKSWAYSIFSLFYIALPLSLIILIYSLTSPIYLLAMFAFIWINDTGAFLVGCTLGRNKLFERISPKKSWEGFFGGLILCILIGYFVAPYIGLNSINLATLGFIVSIFATFGDLIESLIKRTVGVKDSGNIMPGHGGILDRIDSLLLVAPATLLFILITNSLFN